MLRDLHQSFRMNFNFILLLLCTAIIFASVWSLIFNCHFCSVYKVLSCCFSSIIHIFQKWLSIIFRKYWYLLNNKSNKLYMLMKIKTRMLVFLLFTVWSYLLMNLIKAQISYMFLLFSMMRIDFSRIIILWRLHNFVKSRWTNHWC